MKCEVLKAGTISKRPMPGAPLRPVEPGTVIEVSGRRGAVLVARGLVREVSGVAVNETPEAESPKPKLGFRSKKTAPKLKGKEESDG